MKRKAKRKKEEVNIPAQRQELYAKHLEADGVPEAVCNGLVDHELRDRRITFPSTGPNDLNRIYDYWTDSYTHVHVNPHLARVCNSCMIQRHNPRRTAISTSLTAKHPGIFVSE